MYAEKELKATINNSSSGDNEIIAAPGDGCYLAIDFISFIPTSAVTIQFKTGSTNYCGALPLTSNQTLTWENSCGLQDGVMTMANNEAFVMNLGGAVQIGGLVRYRIIGK